LIPKLAREALEFADQKELAADHPLRVNAMRLQSKISAMEEGRDNPDSTVGLYLRTWNLLNDMRMKDANR
jgi:hypothetical protein